MFELIYGIVWIPFLLSGVVRAMWAVFGSTLAYDMSFERALEVPFVLDFTLLASSLLLTICAIGAHHSILNIGCGILLVLFFAFSCYSSWKPFNAMRKASAIVISDTGYTIIG